MSAPPCLCGHAKRNHIDGHALCLVKSCRLCLIYVPRPAPASTTTTPEGTTDHD